MTITVTIYSCELFERKQQEMRNSMVYSNVGRQVIMYTVCCSATWGPSGTQYCAWTGKRSWEYLGPWVIRLSEKVQGNREHHGSSQNVVDMDLDDTDVPLFYQPGKKGFYTPRHNKTQKQGWVVSETLAGFLDYVTKWAMPYHIG